MASKKKLLLIGWDAADWNIISPLLAENKMPALKKLIDKGVHGNLSTLNPPYSPMLWSTVATGKTPDKHGILGFLEINSERQQIHPITSRNRKTRALWNIFHNQNLKTNLVGWWPSFPAEPINGNIVSDVFPKTIGKFKEEWPIHEGVIHPESLVEEIRDLRIHPMELTKSHVLPFVPKLSEVEGDSEKAIVSLLKILSSNSSIHAAATYLARTKEWDFMGVYYDLIDHMCHAFVNFHPPKLDQVPQKIYDLFNGVVTGAYIYQDMMLERMMDLVGDDTTIIVMSDHGFESGNRRGFVKPKDIAAAPALDHREFGIFVAAGPGIKRGQKLFGMSIIDVAPTILHYFDLPVGRDMDGSPILDAFESDKQVNYIDSWDAIEGDFGELKNDVAIDPLSEQEAIEQLIELGYIERPDEDAAKALTKIKADTKHNLARVYMGKRQLNKAEEILEELIKEDVNCVPFYMELVNIQLLNKKYDKAREYLETLRALDKKMIVRTGLIEAKILIGEGKFQNAEHLLKNIGSKKDKTGIISYELGRLYMSLDKYETARQYFESAVELKSDNAKFHSALATCLLRLDQAEDAADHALIAIELVRYFPDAHYVLGEALDRMGDKENALKAYEMARKLSPKMKRASMAIKKITEDEGVGAENISVELDEIKGEVIIVSGLPRSGTSMMMQMLESGGLDILTDGVRTADDNNPKGYYEFEKTKSLHKKNDWLDEANGKVVKVVAQLLKFLPVGYKYKVIFMKRDVDEVIRSQQVMLKRDQKTTLFGLKEAFLNELKKVEVWSKKEPGVEILYVNYTEVLKQPETEINRISSFLDQELDTNQMIQRIDKKLYRNKLKS